ncbi:hypothetical protein, unknown function [Leishmania tarentolae]|uniref:Uncharacterized protein n=1 Tax=Leishmania tarentolae TaxID=5689 RepID=A0A640KIW6_LEITA|nr:hypothetical protein, unknown function [Leishmania tarentolae]
MRLWPHALLPLPLRSFPTTRTQRHARTCRLAPIYLLILLALCASSQRLVRAGKRPVMDCSATPMCTERTPSRAARKDLTPLRRSGITHLSTPHYAQASVSASTSPLLFTSTSSAAHPAARTFTSLSSRGHRSTGILASSAGSVQRAASARCTSRSSSPQSLRPYTASIRNPILHGRSRQTLTALGDGSAIGDASSNASWRHHVASVCHRLQHTVQEAEQILVPSTTSAATALSSSPLDQNRGRGSSCTLAHAMNALQRYRSGCMTAMLELDALQQLPHSPSGSSAFPLTGDTEHSTFLCSPAPSMHQSRANEGHDAGTSPPGLMDAAQLYHQYQLIKARLDDTLASQSAYMQTVTLQKQFSERERVIEEFMWAARLLVEQEAAERAHLVSLWKYLMAPALKRRTSFNACAGTGLERTASARVLHTLPTAVLPPETAQLSSYTAAAARLAAQNEALQRDLHHAKERTHVLLQEQQKDLQEAHKRSLAQLVVRYDAEKSALEAHVHAAKEEAAKLQHRLTEVKQEVAAAQSAACETQRCAGLTYDGMHRQLKDTTKRMWQLQLANDHLDAKARVLERELEELRWNHSLGQSRQGGNGTASPTVEHARASASRSDAGAEYVSNGCARSDGGGRRGGNAQSVSPGVWCAYEERSNLLASATPVKKLPLCSSLSSGHALSATRRTQDLQHGNSPPSSPFIHMNHPHGSSPAVVPIDSITTGTNDNAYAPTLNTDQRNPPSVTSKMEGDGKGSIGSSRHQLFERTLSPVHQLSLDRTPAQQSSVAEALSYGWPHQDLEGAEASPSCTNESTIGNQYDSVAHMGPSRAQPAAAGHFSSATAQASVAESLGSAIPRLDGTSATISADLQAPLDTECDGKYPNDVSNLTGDERTATTTTSVMEGEERELQSSLASMCSSPMRSGSRARLEAVRRDILRYSQRLEQEVQVVTSRHDAARRQRRRERETLRVNASIHSASNSPATSEPRDNEVGKRALATPTTLILRRSIEPLRNSTLSNKRMTTNSKTFTHM